MQGAVLVNGGEPCDEVLLESGDDTLSGVDPMVVWGNKVNVHIIFTNVRFNGFGAFIVHQGEGGVIIARGKSREDLGEGIDHGANILGGHGMHEDGVEIIYIHNKNIQH